MWLWNMVLPEALKAFDHPSANIRLMPPFASNQPVKKNVKWHDLYSYIQYFLCNIEEAGGLRDNLKGGQRGKLRSPGGDG